MRTMPLVEYAEWMLCNGRYDVNTATGEVANVRTGRVLKAHVDASGYPSVNLAFDGVVSRPIRVHRLIAIKQHGAEAVADKHVAHLDGNKERSVALNLDVMNPGEHLKYDYSIGVHRPWQWVRKEKAA